MRERAGSHDDVVRPCVVRYSSRSDGCDVTRGRGDMAAATAEQPAANAFKGHSGNRFFIVASAAPTGLCHRVKYLRPCRFIHDGTSYMLNLCNERRNVSLVCAVIYNSCSDNGLTI